MAGHRAQPGPQLRLAGAVLFSVGLHAALSAPAWLGLNTKIKIPDFKIEFETVEMVDIVAPELEQGELSSPEDPQALAELQKEPPADPAKPEEPNKDEDGDKAEDKKPPEKKKPKRTLGDKRSRVDKLGPANSRVYALLATRRISKLPYAEQAIRVMEPWPDFEMLVRGAGFHPLQDFNAIAIASSDIRDASQTFLAVDSRLSTQELKAGIERAAARNQEQVTWEVRQGVTVGNPRPIDPAKPDWDPRYFAFIDKRTAVYVRQEFLPSILVKRGDKSKKSAGSFVANIARLRSFVARDPHAGLQVVAKDLRASIKSVKWPFPFEVPNGIEVFAGAQKDPELLVRVSFLAKGQAEIAQKFWEQEVGGAIKSSLAYRYLLGPLYDATKVSVKGKVVELRNQFNTAQAKLVLGEIAKQTAQRMRKTPEEMAKARAERQDIWKKRKGGKLPPSQAINPTPQPTPQPTP